MRDIASRIDKFIARAKKKGAYTSKTELYSWGVKTKLRQAGFSLQMMKYLEHVEPQAVSTGSTTPLAVEDTLSVDEKVNLYCDCFWDFTRSALDILAQLVNECRSRSLSERDVDLKRVAQMVSATEKDSQLDKALRRLIKSNSFRQLEKYRHCSTHNRPVYIERKTVKTEISGTPGYSMASSAPHTAIKRYFCMNPWSLKPKKNGGKREIGSYCNQLLEDIQEHINRVLYHLP